MTVSFLHLQSRTRALAEAVAARRAAPSLTALTNGDLPAIV